jgi:hypothetical protein
MRGGDMGGDDPVVAREGHLARAPCCSVCGCRLLLAGAAPPQRIPWGDPDQLPCGRCRRLAGYGASARLHVSILDPVTPRRPLCRGVDWCNHSSSASRQTLAAVSWRYCWGERRCRQSRARAGWDSHEVAYGPLHTRESSRICHRRRPPSGSFTSTLARKRSACASSVGGPASVASCRSVSFSSARLRT